MFATPCVRAYALIPKGGGQFSVGVANGVLSVQKDGSLETRPAGTVGAWELCRKIGNKLIFEDTGYPTGAYALLLVD